MSNFWDLVNIEEFWEKRQDFNMDRWDVTFYCKDCEKIVKTERKNPKWYIFICKNCQSKNISIWTLQGVREKYKIK